MSQPNKVDVLLGLQWGDEGKGKVVDKLTSLRNYNTVARFQGGPNAGHTVYYETFKKSEQVAGKYPDPPTMVTEKIVIRQVPSGILTDHTINIIGNGCVVDPIVLHEEIERLLQYKNDVLDRLYLDYDAVIITPIHRYIDGVQEEQKKAANDGTFIGTTKRGIGPAYTDKISRDVFHVYDLLDMNKFEEAYKAKLELFHNYDEDIFETITEEENKKFLDACRMIAHGVNKIHSSVYLNDDYDSARVLCEGAQGTMLDIDHGSFPYVTSSNTTIGAVCTGLGVSPHRISNIFGLFKAYCTRVGTGPFPTEDDTETGGKLMQEKGAEFGAVTGRPRRCGWLDLVQLKHACNINGVTSLIMTKADILTEMPIVKVCTAYAEKDSDGNLTPVSFGDIKWFDLDRYTPVYKELQGWDNVYEMDKNGKTDKLSDELLDYIDVIEKYIKLPIGLVSVGPGKEDIVYLNGVFNTESVTPKDVANTTLDAHEKEMMDETIKQMNNTYPDDSNKSVFTKDLIEKMYVSNNDFSTALKHLGISNEEELKNVLKKTFDRSLVDKKPNRYLHPAVDKDLRGYKELLQNSFETKDLGALGKASDKDIKELQQEMVESLPHAKNLIVPEHYGAGKIHCIEMMLQTFGKQSTMDFCKLNAFKYLWRSTHKGKEFQDMDKASKYMEYWRVLNDLPGEADDGSFKAFLNNPSNK